MKQIRKGRFTKKVTPTTKARRGVKRRFKWFWRLSKRKKIAVIAAPILAFLVITPVATYAYYANDIADQERLMNRNNTGVVFTDMNDKTFYSIGRAEQRDLLKLDSISDYTEKALISAEDKNFYEHNGFSIFSIARAAITRYGGGSTITQQLAKNMLLSHQQTYLRKYQELAVAVAIERRYEKDEILEMYLNSVYYGENAFGIQEAAEVYFDKSPADLTLAESAMLIGVLPAPSTYSPISGVVEYSKERQKTVLKRMLENGAITQEQMDAAFSEELKYADQSNSTPKAPHIVEMVLQELNEKYGEETAMRSGYRVKTTLNLDLQNMLEEGVAANIAHIQANGGSNVAAVAIDPKNGEVRALLGSADYNNEEWGKANMALSARQPGSSFKPIYYAAALAEGVITPATVYRDEAININGYAPQNALRNYNGDVTVRKALNWSLNIPAVKIMQDYGVTKAIQAANNMGISTVDANSDYGLSLALGSVEATPMEMTNAYAAFANDGKQYSTSILDSIQDKFGKEIFETDNKQSKQVINQGGAYLISNILSDNSARAGMFGSALNVSGHTVAVKTGTTDNSKDAWTIGYTPSLALGVWVGNNDNTAMLSGGSDMAGPIWRTTMQKALANQQNEEFTRPSSVVSRATCTSNYGIATNDVTEGTFQEVYLSSALPSKTCEPVKKIEVCNLDDKQVQTINEKDFDSNKQSKNVDDCKKVTIEVCELETGEVIEIDEDDFDSTKHSKTTSPCEPEDGSGDDPDGEDDPDEPPTIPDLPLIP